MKTGVLQFPDLGMATGAILIPAFSYLAVLQLGRLPGVGLPRC
jgi:hypothetical protein